MPGLTGEDGASINGPSLIRVPSWVPGRLGAYYLYFSHHKGTSIRLAHADSLQGPYRVHPGGVLSLGETPCRDHIASPDVHLDDPRQEIRLYFHGAVGRRQRTFLGTSRDGLRFTPQPHALGPFYFRVFRHGDRWYAVAKHKNRCGVLLKSRNPGSRFRRVRRILPRMRHAAVHVADDTLLLFFSRIGDCPESILVSRMDLAQPARNWLPTEPVEILRPEEPWEGAALPRLPSRSGPAFAPVHQLRDPAVFAEDGALYLLYTVAGEHGIAIARLVAEPNELPDSPREPSSR
ncbi:MAG: hypothetical protein JXQ29_15780 [Planctomycetes bacterium]|nr:hypothetical protein [Planctomycetota bacterium]